MARILQIAGGHLDVLWNPLSLTNFLRDHSPILPDDLEAGRAAVSVRPERWEYPLVALADTRQQLITVPNDVAGQRRGRVRLLSASAMCDGAATCSYHELRFRE
jgi:hypothetical protein